MVQRNTVAVLHAAHLDTLWSERNAAHMKRTSTIVVYIRNLFYDAAEELQREIFWEEYPIFYDTSGEMHAASKKRNQCMKIPDTTVVIDPSPSVLMFACSKMHHPVRRTLVVTTSADGIRDRIDILAASQSTIISPDSSSVKIQHTFAIHVPANEDEASKNFVENRMIVERVLRYPED